MRSLIHPEPSRYGVKPYEAAQRLIEHGPNIILSEKHHGWLWRLLVVMRNPLVVLLSVLALISLSTGGPRAGASSPRGGRKSAHRGDNILITRKGCHKVGIAAGEIIPGKQGRNDVR